MLLLYILYLLLSNAVSSRRDKSILYSRITISSLLLASGLLYIISDLRLLGKGLGIFGGLFHTSSASTIFQIFLYAVSAVILQLTAFYPRKIWQSRETREKEKTLDLSLRARTGEKDEELSLEYIEKYKVISPETITRKKDAEETGKTMKQNEVENKTYGKKTLNILNKMDPQYKIIEYPLILLFIITGASFLTSSSDIVSIFLSIELQSYGLYLVCSLYRDSELSTSAGLTYFLLGGLSSCFILLGTSLLYVNSGTTSLENYYVIINLSNLLVDNNMTDLYTSNYMQFSLILLSVGFLFKISAAPFHFWSPDVYDAIPTIVTAFVAIIAKISILTFFLELIHYTSDTSNTFNWTIILLYSSFLSLIVGTVLGLNQFRIKRLLAYSTISHLGFILLALSINSIESIQAFMFYLMQYSITNLNAFVLLVAIGYSLYIYVNNTDKNTLLDKNHSAIQLTSQLKGYFDINPVLALSFSITIYSFVGIPPLIGFFAKQMVLSAALTEGYIFISIVAILSSVISAVYYLGVIKQMFFDKSDYTFNLYLHKYYSKNISSLTTKNSRKLKIESITLSSSLSITISVLTLIISLFMFSPQEWLSLINILTLILFTF